MNKKIKFLFFTCLIIICLIFFTILIKFVRLNNIYKKISNYSKYDSFQLITVIEETSTDSASLTIELYKNGISKSIASNGVYTWTDGTKSYLVDELNSKIYILTDNTEFAIVNSDSYASPVQGYKESFIGRLLLVANINTSVKKEKIDNVEYYCIKTKEQNITKRVWLNKITTKITKSEIELPSGDKIKYEYDLNFDTLQNVDMSLPNLTGYTLINGETGRVLTETLLKE